jgi:hypothetical protein
MTRKVKQFAYFTAAQKAALDKESKRTGASVAEIIRRAVDKYLGRKK